MFRTENLATEAFHTLSRGVRYAPWLAGKENMLVATSSVGSMVALVPVGDEQDALAIADVLHQLLDLVDPVDVVTTTLRLVR